MQDLVNQLKQKRQESLAASEQVDTMEKELDKTEFGLALIQAKEYETMVNKELIDITIKVRQEAIDYYNQTSDKNPIEGVSIIINKFLDYDIKKAITWATNNAFAMLKLDKKLFEKHAKSVADTLPLAFVKIEDKPSVRIAKEL